MRIELTPMIAAHVADLAREHHQTPDEVVCRVLASNLFGEDKLDEVLDEIDIRELSQRPDEGPGIPFAQLEAELDAERLAQREAA